VAVTWDTVDRTLLARVHPAFADVLDVYHDAAAIGVDTPIGLSEGEPRQCDLAARKAISPRSSSVFPAPDARLIEALTRTGAPVYTYTGALAHARELTSKGISRQTFYICAKIAEVNLAMTPALQQRIVEVHPEVSFWAMAGNQPMQHKKRRQAGYDERAGLLETRLDVSIWPRKDAFKAAPPAKPDDLLDAVVAAWTARRVAEGKAERLPNNPSEDRHGLRMEIVY
jgi:predicted RNase H-like nuclease